MRIVSPARKAAFSILLTLERGTGHSDELLRSAAVSALSSADKNLATSLVLGVLRWQGWLDQQIQAHLTKPNAKLDREVLIALRLGAFQILHLDRIPAHAAIDESVELAKQAGHKFASGMVNAVLRKLAAAPKTRGADADAAAHPAWLVERWTQQFGEELTCAICRTGQHEPSLAVRIVDEAAEAELIRGGIQFEAGEFLTKARIVLAGEVAATAAFKEGRARIQDEGSQLIAELAGHGSAILDCCAAPGGKTMILAERNPAAKMVACDASEPRLNAMRERLGAMTANLEFQRVEFRHVDAAALSDQNAYDLVLADVPCSGTGTLGRNPEIRHRLSSDDFSRQAVRQREILRHAIAAARPGGRIVYSTCSLEPEEDEQVVDSALSDAPARVLPVAERIESMLRDGIVTPDGAEKLARCLTSQGFLRLIPGQLGTDGFFVALLQKNA